MHISGALLPSVVLSVPVLVDTGFDTDSEQSPVILLSDMQVVGFDVPGLLRTKFFGTLRTDTLCMPVSPGREVSGGGAR
jgi:hypothetical protein